MDCHESNCSKIFNNSDEQKTKQYLYEIIFAAAIYICAFFVKEQSLKIIMFLTSYIIAGGDVLYNAIQDLKKGLVFDEHFLMSIATLGAIGIGGYPEAIMVMILYKIGESLQENAINKSKKSISALMDMRPDYAYIETEEGLKKVHPTSVKIGDIITVKAGEKIPLDGIVVDGNTYVDTSALTGETILKTIGIGDYIYSGYINSSGVIKIKVTKSFSESAVSKILELVENAGEKKAKAENYITKFAKIYTPIVVLCAFLLVFIPVAFLGGVFTLWFKRALTFLIISCPCAFVLSVPLSFFAGIGAASKLGILIKGSCFIEQLSRPHSILFDKTGTLTKGVFKVCKICGDNSDEILKYAAYAEYYSNHPIAQSIKKANKTELCKDNIKNVDEISGKGVVATLNEGTIYAGNKQLLKDFGITAPPVDEIGTVVFVAKDKEYLGYILIADEIKETTVETIRILNSKKIKTTMLTGDIDRIAKKVGRAINIAEVRSELLPEDKVSILEEKIKNKPTAKSVLFVGDGINDAPVLRQADVGIAMGGLGSDAAIESADVIIIDDKIEKIPIMINLAQKTMTIVRENIIFAIGVKILFLIAGALGYMTMWGAVFADVGVTCIAVLNSLRTLQTKSFIKK